MIPAWAGFLLFVAGIALGMVIVTLLSAEEPNENECKYIKRKGKQK